jgi:hypothetical protein
MELVWKDHEKRVPLEDAVAHLRRESASSRKSIRSLLKGATLEAAVGLGTSNTTFIIMT